MKATLIKDNGRQRYYELREPITKGKCDLLGDLDIIEDCTRVIEERLKPEVIDEAKELLKGGIRIVIVSDAITHIERLAFPGIRFKDGHITMLINNIAGKHTYSIEGGDSRAVYPDEVYLRFLARLNGITYEGVEKNIEP